jgi:hypothetical protein
MAMSSSTRSPDQSPNSICGNRGLRQLGLPGRSVRTQRCFAQAHTGTDPQAVQELNKAIDRADGLRLR